MFRKRFFQSYFVMKEYEPGKSDSIELPITLDEIFKQAAQDGTLYE